MGLLQRILSPFVAKSTEGEVRPGPYWTSEGILPALSPWNWWQLGEEPIAYTSSAIVQACVGAYSETIAMCPGDHWRTAANGGRERVPAANSSLARILRRPNGYQSISDFLMNLARELMENGNAYALALRNNRGEIAELHLMRSSLSSARVAIDGSVFYALSGNEIIDRIIPPDLLNYVPQRDVLHVRLQCRRHPLVGESPILSAALDTGLSALAKRQQMAFFANGGRPSAVLGTDLTLTKEQTEQIRERWNEQSRGMLSGGVPILTSGLKPIPWTQNSVDSQLVEQLKMSDQAVALAFRVPLAMLGLGGQTYASTELLMRQWIATGLGFVLNHIEEAIGNLFELRGQPDEYLEFNTDSLLRSAFKERIEGLARAVQGGIMAPNEARRLESLPSVEFGDEPRVQQQVVPLSFAAQPPPPPAAPAPPPAANDDGEDEADEDQEDSEDEARDFESLILDAALRHAAG